MLLSRRGIIGGLVGLVAAPAVVKFDSLMRVSRVPTFLGGKNYLALFGPDGKEIVDFGRMPVEFDEFGRSKEVIFTALRTGHVDHARLWVDGFPYHTPLQFDRGIKHLISGDILKVTDIRINHA